MLHVTRMIRGIGPVLFSTNSQTFEWVGFSFNLSFSVRTLRCRVENFFVSVLAFSFFPSPPSHAPACRSQHASVCRFKTSLCVLAPRPHVLHMWTYTRVFSNVFFFFQGSAPNTPHTKHQTHTTTTATTTTTTTTTRVGSNTCVFSA